MVAPGKERGRESMGSDERLRDRSERLPLTGLRVLVVDDDRIPRRIVSNAVTAAGGTPIEAVDGRSALAIWSSHNVGPPAFDAAVVDFVMPGMDGADVVRTLRGLGYNGAAVGLTAAASDAQVDTWVAAGCDEVLPKGCSRTELVNELTAAYRRRTNRSRFKRL